MPERGDSPELSGRVDAFGRQSGVLGFPESAGRDRSIRLSFLLLLNKLVSRVRDSSNKSAREKPLSRRGLTGVGKTES